MRLQDLYDAAASLAASVLPTGTPSVPAITASATTTDPVAARERLQGALVKAAGGEYFLVPAEASTLGAGSKKIPLSATGNFADATDRSEAQLAALSISEVALNIVLGTASTSTSPTLRVAGKPDGLPVTLAPIIEPALTRMRATVAGGTTTDITVEQAIALVGASWLPWAGREELPPPVLAAADVPDLATADAAPVVAPVLFGPDAARAMRVASLQVLGMTLSSYGEVSALVAGITAAPEIRRPLAIALAAHAAPAPAAPPSDLLKAILATAPPFVTALQSFIDAVTPRHAAVATARAELAALGVPAGIPETGRFIRQAVLLAEAAAPPPPPPPGAPPIAPPGPDPVAAAIAAAMGTATPDPIETEATRRLAALSTGATLTAAQRAAAIAGIAAALRAHGPTPPAASAAAASAAAAFAAPAGPPLAFAAPAGPPPPATVTFAPLRIAGAESLAPAEVLQEIASAYGKSPAELAAAIALAAGKPAADPFFASDAEGTAAAAAAHWATIEGSVDFLGPPTSWLEAGRRLRATADAHRERAAAAAAASAHAGRPSRPAADAADGDRTAIPKASNGLRGRASAAAAAVIGPLASQSVIDAEAVADRCAEPLAEARRICATSYGPHAIGYLGSDGTVAGSMAGKGAHMPWHTCRGTHAACRGSHAVETCMRGARLPPPDWPLLTHPSGVLVRADGILYVVSHPPLPPHPTLLVRGIFDPPITHLGDL